MNDLAYTFWKDDDMWVGYLNDYPNYMTQGTTRRDLEEHLLDILGELTTGFLA